MPYQSTRSRISALSTKWHDMIVQIKVDIEEDRENNFHIAVQSGEETVRLLEGCLKDLDTLNDATECDDEIRARIEEDKKEESAERMVGIQDLANKETI